MTREERLQSLKDIRGAFQIIKEQAQRLGIHNHPQSLAIIAEVDKRKSQVDALVQDAAKAEVTKPKKRIVNFAANDDGMRVYETTERLANEWIDANPDAEILHMESALAADIDISEHCITFLYSRHE